MKNINYNLVKTTLAIMLASLILISCSTASKIFQEHDIVYATQRFKLTFESKNYPMRSPIIYTKQDIIKEITENEITYTLYDRLTARSASFNIEDKVFMVVNDEVFPLTIKNKEYENSKELNENTAEILTSDSTKLSVVTGYSENNRKHTRFCYKLSDEVISKIKTSNEVLFRYYAGPSMITTTIKKRRLEKLKKLIEKQ